MINLDYICMEYGQKIGTVKKEEVKKRETNLRKALGILKEDGVYAMFLWLQKEDNTIVEEITKFLNSNNKITTLFLSNEDKFSNSSDFLNLCKNLQEIAQDLNKLLLLKKLLERTLTYALYHVKILNKYAESE